MAGAKERTILLTLEGDLEPNQGQFPLKRPSEDYVKQFIPTSGLVGAIPKAILGERKTLELVGPAGVYFDYNADVAVVPGLFTSFIQPWFFKPVGVSVRGESYLGTYPVLSKGDKDVERIIAKMNKSLADFTDRIGPAGTGERVLIEIRNNPVNSRRFFGYINHFHYEETTAMPYIFPYDFSFVGRSMDSAQIAAGRQAGRDSLKAFGG